MAQAGPPQLPNVVDEAGDTPAWVPILGLCLLGLAGLWVAVSQATKSDEPEAPALEAAAAEAPADEAEAAAPEAQAEAEAEPAGD